MVDNQIWAGMMPPVAPVVELVDAMDSKSIIFTDVSVRVRPGAPSAFANFGFAKI
jgi:hypothetical protein